MIYCRERTRSARTSAAVLLVALLLNINAHVFVHLGDALVSAPAIGQDGDGYGSGSASLLGNHDCLGCQSLQHRLAGLAAVPVLNLATVVVTAGWQTQLFPTPYSARPLSSRAPPLV